jgi:hypothetical protein
VHGGLEPLVEFTKDNANKENKVGKNNVLMSSEYSERMGILVVC